MESSPSMIFDWGSNQSCTEVAISLLSISVEMARYTRVAWHIDIHDELIELNYAFLRAMFHAAI